VALEEGVEVGHHVVLEGRVRVGAGSRIGHGSVVGAPPQDLKWKEGTPSGVRIGRGTTLREYATVHRATRPDGWTSTGDHCLLQAAFRILYRSGLAPRTGVERIRDELPATPYIVRLLQFIEASKRGICGPPRTGAAVPDDAPDSEGERVF